jgi:Cu/Zn superoxide dismutase
MTRSLTVVLAMATVLAIGGVSPALAAGPVTVQLAPQNNSGESGTATLTEAGGKTKVTVAINGQPAGVAQPMHVHKGTCSQLDPQPAYGLATVTGGKSETTIDVTLASLQSGGYAINGHKSAQDVKTYVFCGEIPKM